MSTFIENKIPAIAGMNEKHTHATSINTGDEMERILSLDIQKRVFGMDIDGKTITDNDIVDIIKNLNPYTTKRGVAVGSNKFGECIVEWWDEEDKKFKKTTFNTDQLRKSMS